MSALSGLTGKWMAVQRTLEHAVKKSHATCHRALVREAAYLARDMKKNIVQSGKLTGKQFTPNAKATVDKKGTSKPLIEHGDLLNAIASHKIATDKILVGIPGDKRAKKRTDGEIDIIAVYAKLNEYGGMQRTRTGNVWIPPRPFVANVCEYTQAARKKRWEKDINNLFQS